MRVCGCAHMCVCVYKWTVCGSSKINSVARFADSPPSPAVSREQILSYSSQTFGPHDLLATVTDFSSHLTFSLECGHI